MQEYGYVKMSLSLVHLSCVYSKRTLCEKTKTCEVCLKVALQLNFIEAVKLDSKCLSKTNHEGPMN